MCLQSWRGAAGSHRGISGCIHGISPEGVPRGLLLVWAQPRAGTACREWLCRGCHPVTQTLLALPALPPPLQLTLSCSSGGRKPVKSYCKTPGRPFKSAHIPSTARPRNFQADLWSSHTEAAGESRGPSLFPFLPSQHSVTAFQGLYPQAHSSRDLCFTSQGSGHGLRPPQLPQVLVPHTLCCWLRSAPENLVLMGTSSPQEGWREVPQILSLANIPRSWNFSDFPHSGDLSVFLLPDPAP